MFQTFYENPNLKNLPLVPQVYNMNSQFQRLKLSTTRRPTHRRTSGQWESSRTYYYQEYRHSEETAIPILAKIYALSDIDLSICIRKSLRFVSFICDSQFNLHNSQIILEKKMCSVKILQ